MEIRKPSVQHMNSERLTFDTHSGFALTDKRLLKARDSFGRSKKRAKKPLRVWMRLFSCIKRISRRLRSLCREINLIPAAVRKQHSPQKIDAQYDRVSILEIVVSVVNP